MPYTIVLLGTPSPANLQSLKHALPYLGRDTNLLCSDLLNKKDTLPECNNPHAFINFYPENMLPDLISILPAGVGERVPFFQCCTDFNLFQKAHHFPVTGIFSKHMNPHEVWSMFSTIKIHHDIRSQQHDLIKEVIKYRKQKQQLIRISTSLSSRNDIEELLEFILAESRDIVGADAGSIYIRKRDSRGKKFTDTLQFRVSQNDSIDFGSSMKSYEIPIDRNTIAGYVAYTGEVLNIPDVDDIDLSSPFKHASRLNLKVKYSIRSMLTVPFKNMAGTVVGVIQLINKKRDPSKRLNEKKDIDDNVVPFRFADEDFIFSIASLAAVTIERAQLHTDIQQIFEGFIDSSIAAVDERDRITSGHSRRVTGYAMAFVDAINSQISGPFADEHFSEERKRQFKFAALLHDIGKIGVPEGLLKKDHRIPLGMFDSILSRIDYIRFTLINVPDLHCNCWQSVEELDDDREFLTEINGAGFLSAADLRKLEGIAEKYYINSYGERLPFLRKEEFEALRVRKGNLTEEEREIVNSHAVAGYRILSKIPWTSEFERIPQIASQHHEKLDGSGYPQGLTGEQIGLESRILAVVDIYEALVAQDRPYKPAMAPERVLAILRKEAEMGHLDSVVVEFFANTGIYRNYLDQLTKRS